MTSKELARQLDAIEHELRRLGLLDGAIKKIDGVKSAFGSGKMSFEQWLIGVFLPNARAAVASGALPAESQVGTQAMREYDGHERMANLASLLVEFDQGVRAHVPIGNSSPADAGLSQGVLSRLLRKVFGWTSRDA